MSTMISTRPMQNAYHINLPNKRLESNDLTISLQIPWDNNFCGLIRDSPNSTSHQCVAPMLQLCMSAAQYE